LDNITVIHKAWRLVLQVNDSMDELCTKAGVMGSAHAATSFQMIQGRKAKETSKTRQKRVKFTGLGSGDDIHPTFWKRQLLPKPLACEELL